MTRPSKSLVHRRTLLSLGTLGALGALRAFRACEADEGTFRPPVAARSDEVEFTIALESGAPTAPDAPPPNDERMLWLTLRNRGKRELALWQGPQSRVGADVFVTFDYYDANDQLVLTDHRLWSGGGREFRRVVTPPMGKIVFSQRIIPADRLERRVRELPEWKAPFTIQGVLYRRAAIVPDGRGEVIDHALPDSDYFSTMLCKSNRLAIE